jgi:hypothetical protein
MPRFALQQADFGNIQLCYPQSPHHELGVHRGPSSVAVEGCEVLAQIRQVEKPIDAAEQVVPGDSTA